MKKCIAGVNCLVGDTEQDIDQFYTHKQMADGHVNRCKTCCKALSNHRKAQLENDPVWVEKEKERQREKQSRLYGDGRYKPTPERKKEIQQKYLGKFPEIYEARKATSLMKSKMEGNELHHWSYNNEHLKDVIELSVEDHATAHRYIIYDQERKMYREAQDWTLLDTKERHLAFINQCINSEK